MGPNDENVSAALVDLRAHVCVVVSGGHANWRPCVYPRMLSVAKTSFMPHECAHDQLDPVPGSLRLVSPLLHSVPPAI